MGKRYVAEINAIADTIAWASSLPIGDIQEFVNKAHGKPLVAVGSGGSVAAAHFAALLHRRVARTMSRHATPLEIILDESAMHIQKVLFLSASGKNKDVLAAAMAAISDEVPGLGVICTRRGSPLASAVRAYSHGYVIDAPIPSGKDGYLATNSLLATLIIIARAYGCFDNSISPIPSIVDGFWAKRDSVLVLHGGWSSPIATDLESRLHESALLNVQISDYRNFGHGRHLWLAQRYSSTFVLALVTPETEVLSVKTLKLLPKNVPLLKLSTKHEGPSGTIDLLVKVLHWTLKVAKHLRVDPGRPSVPDFGRRMFHLTPPRYSKSESTIQPAIERKLKQLNLTSDKARTIYIDGYASFREALASANIGAIVLDYDGTLVRQEERFDPLPACTIEALEHVLRLGLRIGIATGRGKSVRKALRESLPCQSWERVHIGYYNGSDIGTLSDDTLPDKNRPTSVTLASLEQLFLGDKFLTSIATLDIRPSQITITLDDAEYEGRPFVDLQRYLDDLVHSSGIPGVRLLCSGHSFDIIEEGTSKLAVVNTVAELVSPSAVLCIGDRGAWPGNDFELLRHPLSLSVDEVSSALHSCWNLAPRGYLGPSATLRYLMALESRSGIVHINLDSVEDSELCS